jgi:hypothetical protein
MEDGGYVDQVGGDLAHQARVSLAMRICGNDVLRREAVLKKMENLRNELAGQNPSPIERLLAERIVMCGMFLNCFEITITKPSELTFAQGMHRQKLLDRLHSRYLTAIKALADVRRLALPALQVNIARRQVNVTGGMSG